MQGPLESGALRIVLLTVIFGVAAAAHIAALPLAALLGLAAMLWIAEGRRSQTLPVVLVAVTGGLVFVFACYGFSPDASSYVFRSSAGFLWFSTRSRAPLLQLAGEWWSYGSHLRRPDPVSGRSQVALLRQHPSSALPAVLFLLVMTGAPGTPWLWALPFLLTFIGGVFADAYEGPRGRVALAAGGAIVLAQAVLCIINLPSCCK